MFELIALILRAIEKMAEGSKPARPPIDPAWQAQQAEWERSRREWEARQLAVMTGGPPPPAGAAPPAATPPPIKAKSGKSAKKASRAAVPVPPPVASMPTRARVRPVPAMVGGRSAREQFVLCEVLKPPLSMREPHEW